MIDISIIIVNYNVKEFVLNLLNAIFKARHNLSLEIFVVDNSSSDGSAAFLEEQMGDQINLIPLGENLGFGKANNLAIEKARGKYTLIINPDTLIKEDTLSSVYAFMERTPDAAAAGCKLLNPDGSFAPESKRSIPHPASAFWRMIGLNRIFSKSKNFAEYYVPWVDENETAEVPAISGAFMFFKTDVLKELGGFDKRFFMYGEDLDLCFRATETGLKIFYFPETSIIHFKGESTKIDSLDYAIYFNKAMIQFFDKHYSDLASRPFKALIYLGIFLRGSFNFIKQIVARAFVPLFDISILNIILAIVFVIRFSLKNGFDNFSYTPGFLVIHLLATLLYLFFAALNNMSGRRQLTLGAMVKTLTMSITFLAAFTFFVKDFAFSRLVVGFTYIISFFVLALWRLIATRSRQSMLGKFFRPKVIVVGGSDKSKLILEKMMKIPDNSLDIKGIIVASEDIAKKEIAGIPVLGPVTKLRELVEIIKPEMVVFLTGHVSYDSIMKNMEAMAKHGIQIRIVPENMEVLIGKSYVEHLDDMPLIDFNVAYWKPVNRIAKRSMDFFSSVFLFIPFFLFWLIIHLFYRKRKDRFRIRYGKYANFIIPFLPEYNLGNWRNVLLVLPSIIRGRASWVGANMDKKREVYSHSVGITGPVQQDKGIVDVEAVQELEQRYLLNYSVFVDLKLIIKWIINF